MSSPQEIHTEYEAYNDLLVAYALTGQPSVKMFSETSSDKD